MRSVAYLWSSHLPADAVGTTYSGLMHVTGVSGPPTARLRWVGGCMCKPAAWLPPPRRAPFLCSIPTHGQDTQSLSQDIQFAAEEHAKRRLGCT